MRRPVLGWINLPYFCGSTYHTFGLDQLQLQVPVLGWINLPYFCGLLIMSSSISYASTYSILVSGRFARSVDNRFTSFLL